MVYKFFDNNFEMCYYYSTKFRIMFRVALNFYNTYTEPMQNFNRCKIYRSVENRYIPLCPILYEEIEISSYFITNFVVLFQIRSGRTDREETHLAAKRKGKREGRQRS